MKFKNTFVTICVDFFRLYFALLNTLMQYYVCTRIYVHVMNVYRAQLEAVKNDSSRGYFGIILDRSIGPKDMYPRLPIVRQEHTGVVFWLFYCPGQFRSQTHAQRSTVAGFLYNLTHFLVMDRWECVLTSCLERFLTVLSWIY